MANEPDLVRRLRERVERLEALEAIRQLKYRYWRAVDTQDWALLADCLAEDASCSFDDGHYAHEGRDAVLEFISTSIPALRRRHAGLHLGHDPELTLEGSDEALGRWTLHDIGFSEPATSTHVIASYYEDRYVRLDGRWLIRHTGYVSRFQAGTRAPGIKVRRGGQVDSR